MPRKFASVPFGQPEYRRFDNQVEEWEYYRTVGMNSTVIIVDFEDDLVTSMNSFPDVSHPAKPTVDVVPAPYPVDRPDYIGNSTGGSGYRGNMNDREFDQFYLSVKNETFKKDQMLKIETAGKNGRFTCRQCTKIMSLYTFDDDKMKVVQFLAPSIVDRENSYVILDSMTFSSNKDKVRYLLDSFKRN